MGVFTISTVSDAILLVALGLGYIVCYLANREEKALRTGGIIIGIVIIAASCILLIDSLISNITLQKNRAKMLIFPQQQQMTK